MHDMETSRGRLTVDRDQRGNSTTSTSRSPVGSGDEHGPAPLPIDRGRIYYCARAFPRGCAPNPGMRPVPVRLSRVPASSATALLTGAPVAAGHHGHVRTGIWEMDMWENSQIRLCERGMAASALAPALI
jgi:hypothetical protein